MMDEFLSYRVRDAMTPHPVVIGPETRLAGAEDVFAAHHFNGLPVVDPDGRLRGLLGHASWIVGIIPSGP